MRIKSLHFKDFRNISEDSVSFPDETAIFYGGVGEGKTNILEAIFLLSIGRSHRTSDNSHTISWGKNEAYVRGESENSNGKTVTAIKISKTGKRIEMNGESGKKSLELLGGLRTVMFHSDDIGIVNGAPSSRRRFMDISISQISKNYAYNLRDYYKILKQRNTVLATRSSGMNLDEWDEQLSKLGSWITQVRSEAISEIYAAAKKLITALIGGEDGFEMNYVQSGNENQESFFRKLTQARGNDISRGATTVGPHRDDIKISLGGADARHFASSGEKKTIALAIKLAEVEFIRNMTGEKPIVLLDDVFSSLDSKRSKALLGVTGDGTQCIITTTDLNCLMDELKKGVSVYEVKKGKITRAK